MAQWSVYYDFPFCSEEDMRNGTPGRDIPVNKEFICEGETWKLLSIYCFDTGLAVHGQQRRGRNSIYQTAYRAAAYIESLVLRSSDL